MMQWKHASVYAFCTILCCSENSIVVAIYMADVRQFIAALLVHFPHIPMQHQITANLLIRGFKTRSCFGNIFPLMNGHIQENVRKHNKLIYDDNEGEILSHLSSI